MSADPQSLARRYAAMSDEELCEAAREGADAYRPDAWQVIDGEIARRGLRRSISPGARATTRAAARAAARAARDRARRAWTPGLKIAFVPAIVLTVVVVRTIPFLFAARGGIVLLFFVFVHLWFGIALVVDFLVDHAQEDQPKG